MVEVCWVCAFMGENEKMGREAKEGIGHTYKPCKEFEFRAIDFTEVVSAV